jgi:hypothetical protein
LGDRLLNSGKLSSTDALFNELKGFVLSSTTVDGRVLSFSATSTLITIYYHSLNDPAAFGTDANQKFELVYNSSCESFSVIDHQYFHSALSPLSYGQEL